MRNCRTEWLNGAGLILQLFRNFAGFCSVELLSGSMLKGRPANHFFDCLIGQGTFKLYNSESMIHYKETKRFHQNQLKDLFASVGWGFEKHPDRLISALENSNMVFISNNAKIGFFTQYGFETGQGPTAMEIGRRNEEGCQKDTN